MFASPAAEQVIIVESMFQNKHAHTLTYAQSNARHIYQENGKT
jgi:hypothetical protein